MNYHHNTNKKISFDPYIPQFAKDEELYGFLKVFEDFLNGMYSVASEQNYTNTVTHLSASEIEKELDNSPILYKYGNDLPVITSQDQLDPGPAYPDLTQRS